MNFIKESFPFNVYFSANTGVKRLWKWHLKSNYINHLSRFHRQTDKYYILKVPSPRTRNIKSKPLSLKDVEKDVTFKSKGKQENVEDKKYIKRICFISRCTSRTLLSLSFDSI